MKRLFVVGLLVAACTGSGGSVQAPDATVTPTPTPVPTPTPWTIEVTEATYTKTVRVGGDVVVNVKVKNTGKIANAATRLQFSDLDKYADFNTCKPKCADTDLFGISLDYPGVGPGKTVTLSSTWVATKAGAIKWSVCVYDEAEGGGEQIGCYDAKTTIR